MEANIFRHICSKEEYEKKRNNNFKPKAGGLIVEEVRKDVLNENINDCIEKEY